MEDNKNYIISLDSNVDINYLPFKTHFYSNNSGTVPIWSAASRNKSSDEFYEFELIAKEENASISEFKEDCSMEQCHICDTSVPTAFIHNHYTSEKHKTCAAIIHHALRRASKHVQSVPYTDRGSATKSFPARESGDVLYFCDHCSSAVKLENKDAHEKTKEHQVSVIHDRLLSGLLITYLDKSKVVADSRYQAKASDASDDSTKENDDVGNIPVDDFDLHIKHDEFHTNEGNQSNIEKNVDDELIISNDHCQENDDVAYATYLMLCEDTSELCEENKNNESEKIITNQDKDNHKDAIVSNEQDTIEIVTMEGLTFKVPINNYHGLVNSCSWTETGKFDCLVCDQTFVDTETHKIEPSHIELITRYVPDFNCVRQIINDVWHHCIICNRMFQNKMEHVSSKLHKKKIHRLQFTRKQLKVQNKAYYCLVCNCTMHETSKEEHLNGSRHAAMLLRTNDTAKNRDLHHHLNKFAGKILCIICKGVVHDDDIHTHVKSNAHDLGYKKLLVANKMTMIGSSFNCYACNYKQKIILEIDHVQSKMHKNKLSVYKPVPSLPLNTNSIEDIDFLDDATEHLLYLFESSNMLIEVRCKVCKVNIKSKYIQIKGHLNKEFHQFNLQALLVVNKIKNRLDGTYFCEVCRDTVDFTKEIDHINSYHHERNIRLYKINIPLSWRERDNDISSAVVSSADSPVSEVILDHNIFIEKLSTTPTEIDNTTRTYSNKTSKPRESFKFKQLLQMNKLTSIEDIEDGEMFFCDLCVEHVANEGVIEHVQSESHLGKLTDNSNEEDKNTSQYYCEACQTHVPNIYYVKEIHDRSKQHKLNIKNLKINKKVNTNDTNEIDTASSNFDYIFEPTYKPSTIKCKVCQRVLKLRKKKRHLESPKHITKINLLCTTNKLLLQFTGKYLCVFCNDENVEIEEMLDHIISEKHINNITASTGTDSINKCATKAKTNTEKEIIIAQKEERNVSETLQSNENQPSNENSELGSNAENQKDNTLSFASANVHNKAIEKHMSLKNIIQSLKINEQLKTEEHEIDAPSSNFDYMFEPGDQRTRLRCKVCKHILKFSEKKLHVVSSKHIKEINLLCTTNKLLLQFTGKYLCIFCNDENVEIEEMLNHIVSEKHINNINASTGTDSRNKCATKAKSNTEKEIIIAQKEERNVSKTLQPNENQSSNDSSTIGSNAENQKDNTQSFAYETLHNKAIEKQKSLKNKMDGPDSVKLLSYKVNDNFDNVSASSHASSGHMNADVKNVCNKDMNNYIVEVPSKPTEVYCKICETVIPNTEGNIRDHLKGKRHKSNCDKISETMQREISIKTKTNFDKSCDKNATKTIAEHIKTETDKNSVSLQDPIFTFVNGILVCRCCNVEVPYTQNNINTHSTGWKHKFKLSAMLAENGFTVNKDKIYCNMCDVQLPNFDGITHIDSSSHKMKALVVSVDNTAEIN